MGQQKDSGRFVRRWDPHGGGGAGDFQFGEAQQPPAAAKFVHDPEEVVVGGQVGDAAAVDENVLIGRFYLVAEVQLRTRADDKGFLRSCCFLSLPGHKNCASRRWPAGVADVKS